MGTLGWETATGLLAIFVAIQQFELWRLQRDTERLAFLVAQTAQRLEDIETGKRGSVRGATFFQAG
jgi:hypothetical protein